MHTSDNRHYNGGTQESKRSKKDTDGTIPHYWNQALCRVSRALSKALNTLGKGFVECHTQQRAHGKKKLSAKQHLPSAFYRAIGKAEPKNLKKYEKYFNFF
jgi:hypothetical protein